MHKKPFVEKNNQMPQERRRSARLPFECDALILTSVSSDAIQCRVINISETGAKLLTKSIFLMPQTFKLLILDAGLLYKCETVRRDVESIGVRFLSRGSF